ncbi:MAG TPA: hypothetical protein VGS96_03030 [Thermoanaerobaculia bacterium]|jgi:hypothetical protein|nr:hypothetical protein [Thermoanaerobaculia bacterium]
MKAFALRRGEKHGELVGRILCHDVRGVFRKGHVLRADDIPLLIDASWSEIHLLELGPDDLDQRQAGERLAQILSSAGLESAPSRHRHVLRAKHNGLLKIDTAALQRLNNIPGIAVFTLMNDQVISADQVVAEMQITPLAIERRAIEEAAREQSVIRLLSFVPRDVVVWMRDDRVLRALGDKLRWFGCDVREVLDLPRDAASIRESMERRRESLFLVSGSNALDPLDPVFAALEQMGAKMQRIGMPVHPGTLLWIATWRETTIIGLPTCGLGPQVTAFDLVLPKILAEGGIRDEELAALGHGGILNFARARALEQEPVDEPVR